MAIFLPACVSHKVSTAHRPTDYFYSAQPQQYNQQAGESLFKSDKEVISDADIEKILNHKLTLPRSIRIAILPLGQRTWWSNWSNEFARLNETIEENFIGTLRSSDAVYDASYLPSLVVPKILNLAQLREAAARYQADLLFMYRASFMTFAKRHIFSPDETKAYSTVEAIILDTRTGVIPFTSVTTKTFSVKKKKEDLNFSETIQKARINAAGEALSTIAEEFVVFLKDSYKK